MPVNLEWPWPRSSLNAIWSEQLCGPLFPHSISLEKILSLLMLVLMIAFLKAINSALCTYFLLSRLSDPIVKLQALAEYEFYNFSSYMLKRTEEQFD